MIVLDGRAAAAVPGLWARGLVVSQTGSRAGHLPEPHTLLNPAWTLDNLKDDDIAQGFRKVSWAVGVDPTKNRPSGEALARRILGGKPLPVIHPLVDAYNLGSAATLVPIGAYDLAAAAAPLSIRPAAEGESFHGIGRQPEPLAPGRLVYATASGVVCGVFMWRDSQVTAIGPATERALLMSVGADPVPPEAGELGLKRAAALASQVGFEASGCVVRAEPA